MDSHKPPLQNLLSKSFWFGHGIAIFGCGDSLCGTWNIPGKNLSILLPYNQSVCKIWNKFILFLLYLYYIHTTHAFIQVWAASGTAIVSIAGMILFKEQKDTIQLLCLVMIVLGVVGLELRSPKWILLWLVLWRKETDIFLVDGLVCQYQYACEWTLSDKQTPVVLHLITRTQYISHSGRITCTF